MKLKIPLSAYFDGVCPSGYTLEYVLVNSRTEMKYTRDCDGACLRFEIVMDEDWPEEYDPESVLDYIRDCFLYEDERAAEDRERFGPYDSPSIEDSMPLEYLTERGDDVEPEEEIRYTWMDGCTQKHGSWHGQRSEAVDRGVEAVDAYRFKGGWRYHADEVNAEVDVSDNDLAALGAALLSGHSMNEAYSIWCAEYGAVVDNSSEPRTFIVTNDEVICEDCYTPSERASLGDDDVEVWQEGSEGWTGPVVCARCKSSLPVVCDGNDEGEESRVRVALLVLPPGFDDFNEKDLISLLQDGLVALVGARGPEADPNRRSLARALSIRSVSKL